MRYVVDKTRIALNRAVVAPVYQHVVNQLIAEMLAGAGLNSYHQSVTYTVLEEAHLPLPGQPADERGWYPHQVVICNRRWLIDMEPGYQYQQAAGEQATVTLAGSLVFPVTEAYLRGRDYLVGRYQQSGRGDYYLMYRAHPGRKPSFPVVEPDFYAETARYVRGWIEV